MSLGGILHPKKKKRYKNFYDGQGLRKNLKENYTSSATIAGH